MVGIGAAAGGGGAAATGSGVAGGGGGAAAGLALAGAAKKKRKNNYYKSNHSFYCQGPLSRTNLTEVNPLAFCLYTLYTNKLIGATPCRSHGVSSHQHPRSPHCAEDWRVKRVKNGGM